LAITIGSLPSITETHELVVPKSIPIIFPIILLLFIFSVVSDIFFSTFPNLQTICQWEILCLLSIFDRERKKERIDY